MTTQPQAVPGAYSLSANCALVEDYLCNGAVLVDPAKPNQIAPFCDSAGLLHCLAVQTGDLVHVRQTPGVSGGWSVVQVPNVSGVKEVVAGTQSGLVVAMYQDGTNAHGLIYSFSQDSWQVGPAMDLLADGLKIAAASNQSEVSFYGLDSNGALRIYKLDSGNFIGYTQDQDSQDRLKGSLAGGYLLQYSDDDPYGPYQLACTFTNSDPTCRFSVNEVLLAPIDISDTSCVINLAYYTVVNSYYLDTLPIVQILGTYSSGQQQQILYLSSDQKVYALLSGGSGPTDTGLSFVSATIQEGDLITLYGVGQDNVLSSLHQTGTDDDGLPTWDQPIRIAPDLARIHAPAITSSISQHLMGVGVSGELSACLLDSSGGWTISDIRVPPGPDTPTVHVTQFHITISVKDANNSPAAGVSLQISSQSLVGLSCDGTNYITGDASRQPLPLVTNALGRLNLATYALGLSTPPLSITAPDQSQLTVAPDQSITDFFTGQAALNDLGMFSAAALQNAQDNSGNPVAPLLQKYPDLAPHAAQALTTIMALRNAPAGATSITVTGQTLYGFTLDFTDSSNPSYTPHTSSEALAAGRDALRAKLKIGSIGDDLEHFAHDVWHGLKSGVSAVTHWVVDLERQIVTVVSSDVESDVERAFNLAINGLESAEGVALSIFHAIGAEVDKVIEWLRFLFRWQDIVATQQAIEGYITHTLPALNATLSDVRQKLDDFFVQQEKTVASAFSNLAGQVDGHSWSNLAAAGSPSLSKSRLSISSSINLDFFNADPRHNWLLNKVLPAIDANGAVQQFDSDLSDPLKKLLAEFSTASGDFKTSVSPIFRDIVTGLQGDPKNFLTHSVADFLTALSRVVPDALSLLDNIIDLVLNLVEAVISIADKIWTQPMDHLQVIGPLLKAIEKISGVDFGGLTLSGLFSVVMAVPVTLAYKVVYNQPPFSAVPSRARQLQEGLGADAGQQALAFTNVGMVAFGALIGTMSDLIPSETPVPKALKFLFILPAVASKGLTWPGGNYASIPLNTGDDWLRFGVWGWGWMGIIKSIAEASVSEEVIEGYEDPVLLAVDSLLGLGTLGVGLVGLNAGESPTLLSIAAKIVEPVPEIFALLKSQALFSEETLELNVALKVLIDFFAGGATVTLVALESVEG